MKYKDYYTTVSRILLNGIYLKFYFIFSLSLDFSVWKPLSCLVALIGYEYMDMDMSIWI